MNLRRTRAPLSHALLARHRSPFALVALVAAVFVVVVGQAFALASSKPTVMRLSTASPLTAYVYDSALALELAATTSAANFASVSAASPARTPGVPAFSGQGVLFFVAAEGEAAGTRLYRIAGPNETADIEDTGGYRLGRGQEGKNFYPTQEQAVNLAQMYNDAGIGGPYSLTSGVFSPDLMDTLEPFNPVGEGPSYFARGQDSLDQIFDVQIHGPVP